MCVCVVFRAKNPKNKNKIWGGMVIQGLSWSFLASVFGMAREKCVRGSCARRSNIGPGPFLLIVCLVLDRISIFLFGVYRLGSSLHEIRAKFATW